MAVTQISRLQHRRGLQQDLPQLASAELGWSVDQRRLYIGNGTINEGAPSEGVTEILTQYSDILSVLKNYTFKGNSAGYIVQTGVGVLTPIVRAFQDKFDDFVSVKDFGATGNGTTDDTAAINRAIMQVYYISAMVSNVRSRRTIWFPAGTYLVTGSVIYIPPYARLVGDGISNTIILQNDASQASLFQLTDSLYQTGAAFGTNSATLPESIDVSRMTLQTVGDKDIAIIDSGEHISFELVEFKGSLVSPIVPNVSVAGAKIKASIRATNNVNFNFCRFVNTRYALVSDELSRNVKLNGCYVSGVYKGLRLGQVSVGSNIPSNYKILNTVFASVASTAIDCYVGVSGVLSNGNHFMDVGNNFLGSGAIATVIAYVTDGNYSIGDTFDRTDIDNLLFARISTNSAKIATLQANVGLGLGTMTISTGTQIQLLDAQTNGNTGIVLSDAGRITYTVTRGTGIKMGEFTFINDGTGTSYSDSFTSGNTSVGANLFVNASNAVAYVTTTTGVNAIMKYSITAF